MAKDKLIGIDLGGTTTKFAILTLDGDIQQKWSIKTDVLANGQQIVPNIVDAIQHRLNLYQLDKARILGVGMGTPGTVDQTLGTVTGAYNLNWQTPQVVRSVIEEALGLPVVLDNDANVAALGEAWRGAGGNDANVAFMTLGTGVGGGIVTNGQLVHGTAGAGGEVGHIVVEPNGYRCTCGNRGCLEQYASATGVVRLALQFAEEYVGTSELKRLADDGEEVTSKMVFDLAHTDDFLAKKTVAQVAHYLGYAAAIISNILNPSAVVIGGGVAAAGEFLRARVEEQWQIYAFPTVRTSTQIKLAELGNDAGVIGAASLVRQAAQQAKKED